MTPFKIMASVVLVAAFLAAAFQLNSRYVLCAAYAADKSITQKRIDVIDQLRIETAIEDLEDRLDNPKLSEERKGKLKERIRAKRKELKAIDNLMVVPK